jgi:hypothetical protein
VAKEEKESDIAGLGQQSKKAAGLSPDGLLQMKLVAGAGFDLNRTVGRLENASRTATFRL